MTTSQKNNWSRRAPPTGTCGNTCSFSISGGVVYLLKFLSIRRACRRMDLNVPMGISFLLAGTMTMSVSRAVLRNLI